MDCRRGVGRSSSRSIERAGAGFHARAAAGPEPLELLVEGQPAKRLKAGEVFFVPAGVVHDGRNVGKGKAVVPATYVVETGKPVASPAK